MNSALINRRARIGVLGHFLVNGAGLGLWASRLPAVKADIGLSDGQIGLVLFVGAIGAMSALKVAGPVIERVGSRRATQVSGLCVAIAFGAPAVATSFATLAAAMLMIAAASSFQDVGMNTQGVLVQRRYGRPLMSSFHASFSIGLAAGAALGAAAAALGLGFRPTMVAGAAVLFVVVLGANRWLLNIAETARRDPSQGRVRARLPHRGLLIALGIIGFASFITEGAAADWAAIYLSDETGASESIAAVGLVAFSTTMTIGRLLGDRLAARLGAMLLIRSGTALAGCALGAGLLLGGTGVGIAMFGILGIGLSIVVPQVFSAAGSLAPDRTPAALSLVSLLSYSGFLLGPATIGALADLTSLRWALLLPAALVLLAMLVA
ncbi:MAG TPA: MFS transporter, partial [Euzebya sp.]|nr:MFS transporter [Euzebya sp.]